MTNSFKEIVWSSSEPGQDDVIITNENTPGRFALTSIVVFQKKQKGHHSLLICNPNPDTWNSLMFPYGSFSTEGDFAIHAGMTKQSVSKIVDDLVDDSKNAQLKQDAANLVGATNWRIADTPSLQEYALRYSQTANIWSIYSFQYFLSSGDIAEGVNASHWIDVPATRESLDAYASAAGASFAENTGRILEDPARLL